MGGPRGRDEGREASIAGWWEPNATCGLAVKAVVSPAIPLQPTQDSFAILGYETKRLRRMKSQPPPAENCQLKTENYKLPYFFNRST